MGKGGRGRKNGGESQVGFNGHAMEWKGLLFPFPRCTCVCARASRSVLSLWMSFQGNCSFYEGLILLGGVGDCTSHELKVIEKEFHRVSVKCNGRW